MKPPTDPDDAHFLPLVVCVVPLDLLILSSSLSAITLLAAATPAIIHPSRLDKSLCNSDLILAIVELLLLLLHRYYPT